MDESDGQLIARFRDRNDLQAVEQLFQRYQDAVFGFLVSMLKEPHDAEDALQETFCRAIGGLQNYREQQHFKAWLFRIARNEAVTIIRKRRRVSLHEDPYQAAEIAEVDSTDLPVEKLTREEVYQSLEEALKQLPAAEREVVVLRLQSDVPFKEIASLMDCSINTVLGRMHNAKKRLRHLLLADQPI